MIVHYHVYSSINLFMYCVLFLGPSDWNRYWTWKLFEFDCHGSKNFKPNRRTGGREHNTKEIGRNEPTLELPESQKYCNKVSNISIHHYFYLVSKYDEFIADDIMNVFRFNCEAFEYKEKKFCASTRKIATCK